MKGLRYFANAMWFFMGMDVTLIATHIKNGHAIGTALAMVGLVGCGVAALFMEKRIEESQTIK